MLNKALQSLARRAPRPQPSVDAAAVPAAPPRALAADSPFEPHRVATFTPPASSRVVFVDLARACAVVFMIQGHTLNVLLAPEYATGMAFNSWLFLRGLTSRLFLLLAGFAFAMATSKHWDANRRLSARSWRRIRRFTFFVLLGYSMRFPVSHLRDLQDLGAESWQVLPDGRHPAVHRRGPAAAAGPGLPVEDAPAFRVCRRRPLRGHRGGGTTGRGGPLDGAGASGARRVPVDHRRLDLPVPAVGSLPAARRGARCAVRRMGPGAAAGVRRARAGHGWCHRPRAGAVPAEVPPRPVSTGRLLEHQSEPVPGDRRVGPAAAGRLRARQPVRPPPAADRPGAGAGITHHLLHPRLPPVRVGVESGPAHARRRAPRAGGHGRLDPRARLVDGAARLVLEPRQAGLPLGGRADAAHRCRVGRLLHRLRPDVAGRGGHRRPPPGATPAYGGHPVGPVAEHP